jgi:RNA polymerase sigma-70 factor, ECF subfamily
VSCSNSVKSQWCERLYETKAAGLILYGRALGLSHWESEDVVQEVFTELLKRPQVPEKPEHYCLVSFRHRALNYKRGLWRRVRREFESNRWFDRADEADPAETAAVRALTSLPVLQREVIVLKIWHERTFDEIGRLLSISPNTAAGRYRYGLRKLQKLLIGIHDEQLEPIGEPLAGLDPASPLREA